METEISQSRCKIRCKFWIPVPNVFDPTNEKAILATLPEGHPLKVALTNGGCVLLESKSGSHLMPVRQVSLRSLNVVPASLCDGETSAHGLAIRLPADLARIVHAWEACQEGVDYKWEPFFSLYLNDLGKESGRRLRRLLAARINGVSGQVVTDARCKRGEVHLAPKAAEKLLPTLKKQYPELEIETVAQMDGLRVVLQRFPVTADKGCRWVTLRIVEDRPHMLLYVNAVDWNKLHGGDEDGDLGYIGIPRGSRNVKLVSVAPVVAWPQFRLVNNQPVLDQLLEDWTEKGSAEKVRTVTNFFTKDCIGPQTYMFGCLARAAAFEYARTIGSAPARTDAMGRIMRGIFKANGPLAENTFDGRKEAGDALARFMTVVETFQDAVAGKTFAAEPFFPFLENDQQRQLLAQAVQLAGGSLRGCRATAYGMIVASGRGIAGMVLDQKSGKQVPRAGQIIDRLLRMGIEPDMMMDRLIECAMGRQFIELPRQATTWSKVSLDPVTEEMDAEPEEDEEEETDVQNRLLVQSEVRGIHEILQSIKRLNIPVFSSIKLVYREQGDVQVEARLREAWAWQNQRTWKVTFLLPDPATADLTPDGHKRIVLEGTEDRLFLPRIRWNSTHFSDGIERAEVQRFDTFLAHVLAQAVEGLTYRSGSLEPAEVSEELNLQIRRQLNELPRFVAQELPVRMSEFEVIYTTPEKIVEGWVAKEAALTVLAEHGYDVTTTSKSDPGAVVTRSWKRGVPRHLFAVNPLIPCLDLKRRPEGRERRLALELFHPVEPSVQSTGSKLPKLMRKGQTELVCMIGDVPGYNQFVDDEGNEFGHDTGIVLQSAVEKLAVVNLKFTCKTQMEVDELTERLLEAGMGIDAIQVERNLNLQGDGLSLDNFQVLVDAKVTDLGKIKACIGPFKFVMNPIPHRVFALNPDGTRTEIDVILPGTTVRKKKALDALLYMLAVKAGITEIDPDFDPATLLVEIRERLRATWMGKKDPTEEQLHRLLNGMQPILVVNPDGTEERVGYAVVGILPFYRPVQTGFSQFKLRTGEQGIKVQTHAMLMAGEIEFNIPRRLKEEFGNLIETRRQVQQLQFELDSAAASDWEFEAPVEG